MINKTDNSQRINWIDSLRGFAILLVIVGHLIQFNFKSGIENDIFNIIYSFHMPLFFFISGVCVSFSQNILSCSDIWQYSMKKFCQLIIPSITWTLITPLFFSHNAIENINLENISSFWFLNILFATYIVWGAYTYLCSKFKKKNIIIAAAIILWIILFAINFKRISLMYLALFAFGYFFQTTKMPIFKNKYLLSLLALIFLLLCGKFEYGTTVIQEANRVWLEFPLSIIASILLAEVFKYIKKGKIYSLLNYIGKYTLGIYLCHFIFIHINGLHYIETIAGKPLQVILLLATSAIISIFCIGIQKIIEPFTLLYKCMYGKWNIILKAK